jgi:hypothetical protein
VRPRILASIVVLMLGAATVAQAHPLAQAQGGPEQSRGATDVEGRGPEAGAAELPFAIDGPPPPALPERISRDDSGRATIRAIGLAEPLRLDGRLDEMVYEQEQAISDFIHTDSF